MTRIQLPTWPPFEWWQSLYPDLRKEPGNDTFACSFHDEQNGRSLSLRVLPSGKVLAFCHGKCGTTLAERVQARFQGDVGQPPEVDVPPTTSSRSVTVKAGESLSPLQELSNYTGVSVEFLHTLDLREVSTSIEFSWPGKKVVKVRSLPLESKQFQWAPPRSFAPPLWPAPPEELPDDIVIVEGETDCIVIRSLDVPAFALTKGGGSKLSVAIFAELRRRGAKTVYLVPDVDETGQRSRQILTPLIEAADLEVHAIDLSPHVKALDGEKDLRALFLRAGRNGLLDILDEAFQRSHEGSVQAMRADEVMEQTITVDWLAPQLVARGSMTLLSGQPKAGKTTFMMQLTGAFEKGESFLNRVCKPARILLLTENRSVALQEKLRLLPGGRRHVYVIDRYRKELVGIGWDETVRSVFETARSLKVDLVILDTFMAWAQPEDENSSTEILEALDPLSRAVERTNIALVIVHHLNKDGTSPRGSGAFQAECDTIVNLTHARGGARRISVVSNIIREPVDDLVFTYDGNGYTIVRDEQDPFDEAILVTLDVIGETTLTNLHEELDPPYNTKNVATVRERLKRLTDIGLVIELSGKNVNAPKTYKRADDAPNVAVRRV